MALFAGAGGKRRVSFGKQETFAQFGGDMRGMAPLAIGSGHIESPVRCSQGRAGQIVTPTAELASFADQQRFYRTTMRHMTCQAFARTSRAVDKPLGHLVLQFRVAAKTKTLSGLSQQLFIL